MDIPCDKELYTTAGERVVVIQKQNGPDCYEEADTRPMVHVLDASLCGHRRIRIRTNDTD